MRKKKILWWIGFSKWLHLEFFSERGKRWSRANLIGKGMSLRTKIRGYTAWVNLRLKPYDHLMNNVIMDLLSGTNMKYLCQSLTGRTIKRLESMEGLTQSQKQTRLEWVLDELKKSKILPDDVFVDTRLFVMRSADHIFELLWRLVCHDIWFMWERAEYLQHDNPEVLCEVPFKWIPEAPPVKKKKYKQRQSLLTGFGSSSIINEKIEEDEVDDKASYDPFPRSDYMKKFKGKMVKTGHYPPPDRCILELVNTQLMSIKEGEKLNVSTLDELVDSRVLCALLNSFVPNTFCTEVLLNDRWSINLVLRTAEKLFFLESPMDSEDLAEANPKAVCGYLCVFFMVAYKFRQSQAVVTWMEKLKKSSNGSKKELEKFPPIVSNLAELNRRKQLKTDIENIKLAQERTEKKFDVDFCYKWIEHVSESVKQMQKEVRLKIKERFDLMSVPRTISINDLILSLAVNLSLTGGSGFYLATTKESVSEQRKIVLRDKNTGQYSENFTSNKGRDGMRRMLKLPVRDQGDLDPDKFPKYQIFLEATSRNKQLKNGATFLYQVFPSNMLTWNKIFLKAIRDSEVEMVERMLTFFRNDTNFVNCKEPQTLHSPLHIAAKLGLYDIVLLLLESGANIDQKNSVKQTPIFLAIEGLHRSIAHLLVEWGCDIHVRGPRNLAPFETIRSEELREHLITAYEHYSSVVPRIIEGDVDALDTVIQEHVHGMRPLNSLRSRFINGSTALHTAAYFGVIPIIREVLNTGLDINILDYKGATALHRAKDTHTMKVLMENGIKVNVEDNEGNTPLHVKSYGETGKLSEIEAIQALLENGAKLPLRNSRGLMPVHCAAMQGRADVMQLLIDEDKDGLIKKSLAEEGKSPPSVVNLSVANDFTECAQWLLESNFEFKPNEQDLIMQRILSEQLKLENRADAARFLLESGADPNPRYPGGNSALHYAAAMSGPTDVLEVLLEYSADIEAVNEDGATALFFACQCNNTFAASVLIGNGSNVRVKNLQGLTAFDFVMDYDEWIECGYFSDEIRARLKAYSLKHARDLIRAISKKVKGPAALYGQAPGTAFSTKSLTDLQSLHSHSRQSMQTLKSGKSQVISLPQLKSQ